MSHLPPLENDREFERLVRDICRIVFAEPSFELYGRRGEQQHGIDGYALVERKVVAFQCKKKDVVNIREGRILNELKSEMTEEATKAHQFFKDRYSIQKYIFATTYKNTKHLQDLAVALSSELGFPVEYWGWDTISEYVQRFTELAEVYYPQFIIPDTKGVEKCVWFITKSEIQNSLIRDNQILLEKALDYYKINDNERLVFEIVCNDLDIPNSNVIQKAKETINSLQAKAAFWITGEGGTGKTSLLIRLAVEYALQGESVFFINFENPNLKHDRIPELLKYIKTTSRRRKAFIFVDNPAFDYDLLEFLLKDIVNHDFDFIIVFTERTIRLDLIKKENIQYAVYSQNPVEPQRIVITRSFRERVYRKFYELIGHDNPEIWQIVQEIGVDTNLAFVNATYRILYQLNQRRYIDYVFDWVEYENMARHRFPSLINGFKYVALFYLFEIKTPLSILINMFNPPRYEIGQFKDSFSRTTREPLIVTVQEKSIYDFRYFLRTKHEIISELYFEEKRIEKNQLLADVIRIFNENDPSQVQTLVNLFGNRRNIQQYSLNFKKLLNLCFSDPILGKVRKNSKLHETLYLSQYWIYLYHDGIEKATNYLEGILIEFPQNLHSRTELAKIYQHQNKYEEAERILLDLLRLDKNNLYARTELAKIYQHQDKYKEAEDQLLQCLKISPKDLNSRTELAKIYQHQNKYEEAEDQLLQCLKISPKDLNSRTELAKIYQHQNKYEEAERILLDLLRLDKNNLHARTELAKIYQHRDKYEEAEDQLLQCLKISPKDLNSRTELAKIYQHQNKYKEAEDQLLQCLKISPKDLHSRTELAKIYQHQDKHEEAERILLESLKIDNKQLHPRTELAKIYQHQDKYEEAERILLESLKIDNKQLHPRTELAKIYQHKGDYDKAIKYLKQYLELDKKGLHPRTELAKIYQHQDKYEEAERILLDLLKLDKNDLQARTELAKIYQHQNKYEEAERILLDLLKLDKNDLHARTELAKIYQHQNKYEEAERILLDLLKLDRKNIHAMSELISVYHKMSQPDKCFEEFDKFLARIILRKVRTPQPMFNNIFKLCYAFARADKASEYFQKYNHILDNRNITLYARYFGGSKNS